MNVLLIFFALPLATIVISIALQKIFRCPILVSAIVFSIFLIITFVINNINFLIAAIIYTIISYISAIMVHIIFNCLAQFRSSNARRCGINRRDAECVCGGNRNELLTISSSCGNMDDGTLLTISSNRRISEDDNCQSNKNCCNYNDVGRNGVRANVNVIPNECSNGRTGCITGRYRRY